MTIHYMYVFTYMCVYPQRHRKCTTHRERLGIGIVFLCALKGTKRVAHKPSCNSEIKGIVISTRLVIPVVFIRTASQSAANQRSTGYHLPSLP